MIANPVFMPPMDPPPFEASSHYAPQARHLDVSDSGDRATSHVAEMQMGPTWNRPHAHGQLKPHVFDPDQLPSNGSKRPRQHISQESNQEIHNTKKRKIGNNRSIASKNRSLASDNHAMTSQAGQRSSCTTCRDAHCYVGSSHILSLEFWLICLSVVLATFPVRPASINTDL